MPNRSKTDIVERVKLLEEEVYPSGTNTPDTATAGEDGNLDLVNTGEIDIGKLVSALDASGYDITGVGELESDSLNTDEFHTVSTLTTSAINEALNEYEYVKLKQGETYTGDTTITLEADEPNADWETVVIAYGAKIDYTGDGVAIDIPTNNTQAPGTPYKSRVRWVGGLISGPGRDVDGTRGFRVTDNFYPRLKPTRVASFEYGFYVRNQDAWSEEVHITSSDVDDCDRALRCEGATYTGGSGTDSMKNMKVDIKADAQDNEVAVEFLDASPYAGNFYLTIFMRGDDATGVRFDGGDFNGSLFECEMDGGRGTAFDLQSMAIPPLIRRRKLNVDTEFNDAGNITVPSIGTVGADAAAAFSIDVTGTQVASFSTKKNAGYINFFNDDITFRGGNANWIDGLERLRSGGGVDQILFDGTGAYQPPAQDLSNVSGVDGYIYNHNGANSITADGASTSAQGYYVWSETDSEWKQVVAY
jgi:hypothetical protein